MNAIRGAEDDRLQAPWPTIRIGRPAPSTLVPVALAAAVAGALYLSGGALGTFAVGFVYIVAAYPAVQVLARRGLPRWAAVIAVFALTLLVGLAFAIFVIGFLSQTATLSSSIHGWLADAISALLGQLVAAGTSGSDAARFYDTTEQLADRITRGILGVLAPGSSDPLRWLGSFLAFTSVPFWVFYLLKDWPRLSAGFDRYLPSAWAPEIHAILDSFGDSFSAWIRGQLVASGIAGLFTFIEFELLGMWIDPVLGDVAFVMAAIGFAFEFIPSIGATIALIPYLLVGAAAGGPGLLGVFIGWVIAQQVENAVIVPKVQSRVTDLHPAVIITVLVLGGAIDGLLGVILSVPVTSAVWQIAQRYLPRATGHEAGARERQRLEPRSLGGVEPAAGPRNEQSAA
jgi:predicted PurR-regulated permease PerM